MSKFVKPTQAIVVASDTGKSTLINSLIGPKNASEMDTDYF